MPPAPGVRETLQSDAICCSASLPRLRDRAAWQDRGCAGRGRGDWCEDVWLRLAWWLLSAVARRRRVNAIGDNLLRRTRIWIDVLFSAIVLFVQTAGKEPGNNERQHGGDRPVVAAIQSTNAMGDCHDRSDHIAALRHRLGPARPGRRALGARRGRRPRHLQLGRLHGARRHGCLQGRDRGVGRSRRPRHQ